MSQVTGAGVKKVAEVGPQVSKMVSFNLKLNIIIGSEHKILISEKCNKSWACLVKILTDCIATEESKNQHYCSISSSK